MPVLALLAALAGPLAALAGPLAVSRRGVAAPSQCGP